MSVVPEFRSLVEGGGGWGWHCEFQIILGYIVRPGLKKRKGERRRRKEGIY